MLPCLFEESESCFKALRAALAADEVQIGEVSRSDGRRNGARGSELMDLLQTARFIASCIVCDVTAIWCTYTHVYTWPVLRPMHLATIAANREKGGGGRWVVGGGWGGGGGG